MHFTQKQKNMHRQISHYTYIPLHNIPFPSLWFPSAYDYLGKNRLQIPSLIIIVFLWNYQYSFVVIVNFVSISPTQMSIYNGFTVNYRSKYSIALVTSRNDPKRMSRGDNQTLAILSRCFVFPSSDLNNKKKKTK